ncbi:hypothetical protein K461DRAFT_321273 [Myriangium duriaei CBS 260.36]|uniref:Uncharacterized protein n=1 Tax=Myriangium duriaei CBS 260.36 TaxID=1168546 RepID=A0A9P4IYI5_9PEZI|nr:hypothetical protein K461DRAFT_321273 [Myriangium duriaei CBS 260.36]
MYKHTSLLLLATLLPSIVQGIPLSVPRDVQLPKDTKTEQPSTGPHTDVIFRRENPETAEQPPSPPHTDVIFRREDDGPDVIFRPRDENVIFRRVDEDGPSVIFRQRDEDVVFRRSTEDGPDVIFRREEDGGPDVIFRREEEGGPDVIFRREEDGGPDVIFRREEDSGPDVIFRREREGGPDVIFRRDKDGPDVIFRRKDEDACLTRNPIAEYNLPAPDFTSTNRDVQNRAWDDPELDWTNQVVALDEQHADSLGLPQSRPWPWDETKSTYVLAGAHDMHCVHILRNALNEYHDGVPETQHTKSYPHLLHCLNVLRESTMCAADDTPLYTGAYNANSNVSGAAPPGAGTQRVCRDWSSLTAWTRAHSACFKDIHHDDPDFPSDERYKFCPDRSMPWSDQ